MADLLGLQRRMFSGFRSQWMIDSSGVAKNNNAVNSNGKKKRTLLNFQYLFGCVYTPCIPHGCVHNPFCTFFVHPMLIKKKEWPTRVHISEKLCKTIILEWRCIEQNAEIRSQFICFPEQLCCLTVNQTHQHWCCFSWTKSKSALNKSPVCVRCGLHKYYTQPQAQVSIVFEMFQLYYVL